MENEYYELVYFIDFPKNPGITFSLPKAKHDEDAILQAEAYIQKIIKAFNINRYIVRLNNRYIYEKLNFHNYRF